MMKNEPDDFAVAAKQATSEDSILTKITQPRLMRWVARKPVTRIPGSKVIVSDFPTIQHVLMNTEQFTEEPVTSVWLRTVSGPAKVTLSEQFDDITQKVILHFFNPSKLKKHAEHLTREFHDRIFTGLYSEKNINMVDETGWLVYQSLWNLIGLPTSRLGEVDFDIVVKTLKAVPSDLVSKKGSLTDLQVERATAKLMFVETLTKETYYEGSVDTLPGLMKLEGYSEEETTATVKSLMVSGSEPALSFLPRFTALLVKTRFLTRLNHTPEILPQTIDEAFRVTFPVVPLPERVVTQSGNLKGVKVQPGDRVVLNFASSAETQYFNPDQPPTPEMKTAWMLSDRSLTYKLPWVHQLATITSGVLQEAWDEDILDIISQSSDDKKQVGAYKEMRVGWVS